LENRALGHASHDDLLRVAFELDPAHWDESLATLRIALPVPALDPDSDSKPDQHYGKTSSASERQSEHIGCQGHRFTGHSATPPSRHSTLRQMGCPTRTSSGYATRY